MGAVKDEEEISVAAIISLVEERDHVSVSELVRHFKDGDGSYCLEKADFPNVVLGINMSKKLITAICEALREKRIHAVPCSELVYFIDGGPIPDMPIAKSVRQYKKPRWLPIVFRPGALKE